MTTAIHHQIHHNVVQSVLTSPTGGTYRDLVRRGLRVQAAAKRLCPVDTGRLRSSITMTPYRDRVTVGTNVTYGLYVHEGTGIYGRRAAPIRPVHSRYLVFTPKGEIAPVFARQVRGMPARPFLRMALAAARD